MNQKIKLGLTGNIGCGKSTVSKMLATYPGVTVIDTDSLAKEIAALPEHAAQVEEIVGFSVNFGDRAHRAKLAEKLFSDAVLLDAYQKFIHPLVWKKVDELYEQVMYGLFIVESAILFEARSESYYEKIVMVTCEESVQVSRLCNGPRKLEESDVRARMSLQIPQSVKKSKSDFAIDNSGTEDELRENVLKLYNELNKLIMNKKKEKALFVGSFDPPTLGHEWLVTKALEMYDSVSVAVTVNPTKKPEFTLEERFAMLRTILPKEVSVDTFSGVFTADYAESIGATVLIRGIRNSVDKDYEEMVAEVNTEINPSVRTEYVEAPVELRKVSSSLVRMVVGAPGFECRGWEPIVASKVSPAVLIQIIAKRHNLFRNLQSIGARGNETQFWTKVVTPYLNKNRFYHTIKHIGDMLADFKQVRHLCEDPIAVEYAIWLHDWYYETKDVHDNPVFDNEERSAVFASELAKELGLSDVFCKKVEQLILATKHNKLVADNDSQILVDLDLVILGSLPRVFDVYEADVRKEWEWVHDENFKPIRLGILIKFLEENVYYKEYFRNKFGDQAIANLKASVAKLKS